MGWYKYFIVLSFLTLVELIAVADVERVIRLMEQGKSVTASVESGMNLNNQNAQSDEDADLEESFLEQEELDLEDSDVREIVRDKIELYRYFRGLQLYNQAAQTIKDAIRIEPDNAELWRMYEDLFREINQSDILTAQQYASPEGKFQISQVDAYINFRSGNLHLVGKIKNISETPKRKITLNGLILDKEGKLIQKSNSRASFYWEGLTPGQSTTFEIIFESPPDEELRQTYRVEISGFE